MLKTNTQIKKTIFTAIFTVFMIPTLASAGNTGSYDSGSWNGDSGWGSWGGNSPTYNYSYTPSYSSYTPSYSGYSYTPSYSSYTPSYSSYSYTPSYSYGLSYNTSSVSSPKNVSSTNTNNNSNTNTNNNTNTNTVIATSTSSASANANASVTNNNVNNVYVYTNPTGNAVVNNPGRVVLDGYCSITPSNPRLGQTVTATAYATGGIGNYTYVWGGDINTTYGASTSFTSYTAGIKYINVTIRSDQEIITKTCTVNFQNNIVYGNNYDTYTSNYYTPTSGSSVNITPSNGSSITSGTPISGVFLGDLPATGLSLSFFDYMIVVMVVILSAIFTFVYQAKKRLTMENI